MAASVLEMPVDVTREVAAKNDFAAEMAEWIEAFDQVAADDDAQAGELLAALRRRATETGVATESSLTTPYKNTISPHEEVPYPGDRAMERRLGALIRWNAMAMVHGQNKKDPGIGGHISTYSSTTSSARSMAKSPATSSTSRATPPPESTPAPSSKAASTSRASATSATSSAASPASPATPTPGSCPSSGTSPPSPWASAP